MYREDKQLSQYQRIYLEGKILQSTADIAAAIIQGVHMSGRDADILHTVFLNACMRLGLLPDDEPGRGE